MSEWVEYLGRRWRVKPTVIEIDAVSLPDGTLTEIDRSTIPAKDARSVFGPYLPSATKWLESDGDYDTEVRCGDVSLSYNHIDHVGNEHLIACTRETGHEGWHTYALGDNDVVVARWIVAGGIVVDSKLAS